ncbi:MULTISPECIES: terminase small subunit [Clostridium]|uniref:terminase small subunit n=1 Tax=Clostridium TaxID=1485 RepID=UPI0005C12AAC|nr:MULTISPECIES: terminase small subunit [Clostridium]KIU07721.1 pbsx phage terminase small subunit [Clostridium butyricum]MBA8967552.1 phage terminase small subunit [Clostridium butyricum]MBA8971381.1 phage terminase small subunit [Clostridium butyricum]MBC2429157.1 phage portal protein [Clostridium butyricum]MDB2154599.1 terminase small subunit [Clostridium butyricum]
MDKQNYELAEEDYINGMKYKEIAEKYNVSINTVKSWKTRYKWCKDKKGMHTKSKKVCTQNKKSAGAKKNNECDIKEPIADEVKEVMENEELTDKQRLFCVIYAKCLNATKAYQKIYKCTYETAMVNGCKLLSNTKIKEQLNKLIESDLNYEFLQKSIIQKYKDIAFADINDYIEYGTEYEPQYDENGNVKLDENGEMVTKPKSYVLLNNSVKTDGTLISEISAGNTGVRIKLADRMKALEELKKMRSLLTEDEKKTLDIQCKKLQNEKIKKDIEKIDAEIVRITGNGDNDKVQDDGFIDALNQQATEVWKDE